VKRGIWRGVQLTINEGMKGRESTTYMEENINRTYIGKEKWKNKLDKIERKKNYNTCFSSALTKIHGYLTCINRNLPTP